jgi:2-dehydro-3-deoxyphosphooctonate aldolase (KDO 8-P synthase)
MIISINNSVRLGDDLPFVLIAGPCVVESRDLIYETAERLKRISEELQIPFVFKSSVRKANRTSLQSFTGLDPLAALEILSDTRIQFNVPLLTDIHTEEDAALYSQYVDIVQVPAFLSRQTDLLIAAGKTGKVVNLKKGQFLAPEDMNYAARKVASTGNEKILLTERGSTFGYHDLVVDMRSLVIMKETGYPVVMDATHAVQIPSQSTVSGGQPKFIKPLAMAAAAVGINALFLEVHPNPAKALSDAGSQLPLNDVAELLTTIKAIDGVAKQKR